MTALDKLTALAASARRYAAPPAPSAPWWSVRNAAADRAELMIYGVVGSDWDPDDVTAGSFTRALKAITAPNIDLRVNSPGGLVWDGVAIHTALVEHPAKVTAHVDGVAASAASFIVQAADDIVIAKAAKMMIHDAGALVVGNAADLREAATLLDEISDTIAQMYADRAGGKPADWRARMQATTWYGSAEAVESGLADRVAGAEKSNEGPTDRASQLIRARARVTLGGVQ